MPLFRTEANIWEAMVARLGAVAILTLRLFYQYIMDYSSKLITTSIRCNIQSEKFRRAGVGLEVNFLHSISCVVDAEELLRV
jgi:hypothetical protein